MFGNQPKEDFNQMTDLLWLYKGLLDAMPELWQVYMACLMSVFHLMFSSLIFSRRAAMLLATQFVYGSIMLFTTNAFKSIYRA